MLGTDDGSVLGLLLGTADGVMLGDTEGIIDDDGAVLGILLGTLDGVEDGDVLGTDDGQMPHVALQVLENFTSSQSSLLAPSHFVETSSILNSNLESTHGSHVSHVNGQCVDTHQYLHLTTESLLTQLHFLSS